LLLLGPTISLELFRFIKKEHGTALATWFVALLPLAALTCGFIVDNVFGIKFNQLVDVGHSHPSVIEMVSIAIILVLISWSLLRRGARAFVAELLPKLDLFSHKHHHH